MLSLFLDPYIINLKYKKILDLNQKKKISINRFSNYFWLNIEDNNNPNNRLYKDWLFISDSKKYLLWIKKKL